MLKQVENVSGIIFIRFNLRLYYCQGITDEDKKDLVHWMAYREKRPPSPSPEQILEKMKKPVPTNKDKDRFLECKFYVSLALRWSKWKDMM